MRCAMPLQAIEATGYQVTEVRSEPYEKKGFSLLRKKLQKLSENSKGAFIGVSEDAEMRRFIRAFFAILFCMTD